MVTTDLSKLTSKTLGVPRGFVYSYYTSPAKPNKPTVVLCHGFPDKATLWADVATNHLIPNGYGVIIPDLLGYGGTSKPTAPDLYALDGMTSDIMAIVDAESVDHVISLGHDWGAGLAMRLYNFYPSRVSGLVLLNVAYIPPTGQPFNLDGVLEATQKAFGYGTYHYWKLFTAPDGAEVIEANLESFFDAAHGEPETWMDTLCKPGGLREFLTQGKRQPVQNYAEGEFREEWIKGLRGNGLESPLCWYLANVQGHQAEADKKIKEEAKVVQVPFLFWGGKRDFVCRPELMQASVTAGLVPKLTTKLVDEGHWGFLAQPETFGKTLVGWLADNF